MSDTNDTQAPYGEKREPLLSDEELDKWQDNRKGGKGGIGFKWTAPKVRDFYENLIDKGELRVVKKITGDPVEHIYECAGVHIMGTALSRLNCCPGCGGEIQK